MCNGISFTVGKISSPRGTRLRDRQISRSALSPLSYRAASAFGVLELSNFKEKKYFTRGVKQFDQENKNAKHDNHSCFSFQKIH